MTMTVQREKQRSISFGIIALIGSVVLVAVAGAALYRSFASGSRAKSTARSLEQVEAVFVSREPPRVVQTDAPLTVPATAAAVSLPSASSEEPATASMAQPFIEARQERRDSVWALQMESSVRDALAALRDKNVVLQSVECASIRCTVEGTFGRGGKLEDIVTATTKVGLTRARFRRVTGGDGTTTFSAVLARKGYNLDGSTKEVAAKAL
jgi:hypothetical protein